MTENQLKNLGWRFNILVNNTWEGKRWMKDEEGIIRPVILTGKTKDDVIEQANQKETENG